MKIDLSVQVDFSLLSILQVISTSPFRRLWSGILKMNLLLHIHFGLVPILYAIEESSYQGLCSDISRIDLLLLMLFFIEIFSDSLLLRLLLLPAGLMLLKLMLNKFAYLS